MGLLIDNFAGGGGASVLLRKPRSQYAKKEES